MRVWLTGVCAAAAMIAAIALPAQANASTSTYCGGWKSPWQECTGGSRPMYQPYGWGDQASVCVGIGGWTGPSCSSGAGAGVYSGKMYANITTYPWIKNNSGGNNYVHGVVLTY